MSAVVTISECMRNLIREYDEFNKQNLGTYSDAKSVLSETMAKKQKKDEIVPDFLDIWRLCKKMRSAMSKSLAAIEKAETTADEKDKLLNQEIKSLPSVIEKMVQEHDTLKKANEESISTFKADLDQFKDKLRQEIVSEVATLITKSQNVVVQPQVRKQTENDKKIPLYATVVKVKKDSDITTEQSYANIAKELKGSSVEFLSKKEKSKSVVVGFSSEEKRKLFEDKLAADSNTSKNFDISRPKKMNPKISISIGLHSFDGLSVNCDNDEELREFIKNDIMERNLFLADRDFNEDDFKLVYMSKQRNEFLVVFRVTPAIREKIRLNRNVLYCGHSRIWVKDWYHVIQCFKCQKIGHRSINNECKSEISTCMYCAGKHQSKNCEHKKNAALKKCANCATSSNVAFKAAATTHNAADFSCPYIQAEIRRLKRNTLEVDQKN